MLNANYVEDELKKENNEIGHKVLIYDSIDSTNRACKELGKSGGLHGTVILANEQSNGRGRLGRDWDSKRGDGIYMSLLLRPNLMPKEASLLTLLAALSVNKGIRTITGLNSFIKWPNDIVVNGKKVCGILTEMQSLQNTLDFVVVGIGVNVNQEVFPEKLSHSATSLAIECGQKMDINLLAVEIIKAFEYYYLEYTRHKEFIFVNEYNDNLVNRMQRVRIVDSNSEDIGLALGINDSGALLVRLSDSDKVIEVVSGEVSVRGIYGYV